MQLFMMLMLQSNNGVSHQSRFHNVREVMLQPLLTLVFNISKYYQFKCYEVSLTFHKNVEAYTTDLLFNQYNFFFSFIDLTSGSTSTRRNVTNLAWFSAMMANFGESGCSSDD